MKSLKKTSLASGGTTEKRIAYLFACRDGTRTQRSTVLRLFRVIKRCAFRETNEFLFLVPSPKIILGRRRRRLLLLLLLP